jgi:hypothetical protein
MSDSELRRLKAKYPLLSDLEILRNNEEGRALVQKLREHPLACYDRMI